MTAVDLLSIGLALPLVVSLTLTGWSALWAGALEGPLPARWHGVLLAAQAIVAAALVVWPAAAALLAAAALYALLAGGAAVLLARRGAVPCGCWGGGGRLSRRLVAADAALALTATVAALALEAGARGAGEGLAVLGALVAAVVCGALVVPEGLYALRGARERAEPFRGWVKGFPELIAR